MGSYTQALTWHLLKKLTTLCSDADIILPNISEAAFITNTPYPGEDASVDEIKAMLLKLANLGPKIAVITGVHIEPNRFRIYWIQY